MAEPSSNDESRGTSRRQFLQTTVAAGAAALASRAVGAALPATPPARRPNLILLLTDDQRADMLGCAGHPILKTPHIDSLAQRGVRFTNAFATSAICPTSRASIITGLYPQSHGIMGFTVGLDPAHWKQSYPMLLRQAGYRTGFVGKWGIDGGPLPTADYDYFTGYSGQGTYYDEGSSKHLTARQAEQAVGFLESCKAHEPFCLQVSFKAPHVQDEGRTVPGIYAKYPYDPAYYWQYGDSQTKATITKDSQPLPIFLEKSMNRTREAPDFYAADYQATMQALYRLHAGIDDAVGAIAEAANRLGFGDNTVIVYASDHGSFYGEHGFGGKWLMHEESIRSPLIFFDPRFPVAVQGSTRSQMALNIDVPETLLDLAGVAIPLEMQGTTLLPLIRGETPAWRSDWYYQQSYRALPSQPIAASEGVRSLTMKYVRYPDTDGPYEQLFDLQNDPREETNLIQDKNSQPALDAMRTRYQYWKKRLPVRRV